MLNLDGEIAVLRMLSRVNTADNEVLRALTSLYTKSRKLDDNVADLTHIDTMATQLAYALEPLDADDSLDGLRQEVLSLLTPTSYHKAPELDYGDRTEAYQRHGSGRRSLGEELATAREQLRMLVSNAETDDDLYDQRKNILQSVRTISAMVTESWHLEVGQTLLKDSDVIRLENKVGDRLVELPKQIKSQVVQRLKDETHFEE